MKRIERDKKVVIIGAGPAGLTAAYQLCKAGIPSVVVEKDDTVGGISRTVKYKGYRFDIGGHRFFTKVKRVEKMWHQVLGEQLLLRPRLSRIYYKKRFFCYPLRAMDSLLGLGPFNSCWIFLSYVWAQLFPQEPVETFEQYICNHFGRRLYRIFFKSYTEKVWGIPCNQISAEWAAQRIKGLSLLTAIRNALLGTDKTSKGEIVKTLINEFLYPKHGPGMMWETIAEMVERRCCEIRLASKVEKIFWNGDNVTALQVRTGGQTKSLEGSDFISSMPIRELIRGFEPAAPPEVLKAAKALNYRDFLTVVLIVNRAHVFPDNWIYIHDPSVKVGRVQNFKNWSPYMVPDPNKTSLGLEYFCFEGDDLWTMPDKELVDLAKTELQQLGLIRASEVEDGTVVRMPKAYPVYDATYAQSVETVRNFVKKVGNLHLVGRNGMHKYNNQDHSMLTAMLAVENILGAQHDIWQVNTERDYHEEVTAQAPKEEEFRSLESTQPKVPQPRVAANQRR